MNKQKINIIKTSGEKVKFSLNKLRSSLRHSGASKEIIDRIVDNIRDELYHGISTKQIYNRAYSLLKKEKNYFASKYKLKKAIYELGPTGFPFEKFVSAILKNSGYKTLVGQIIQGSCVKHEIDVVANKNNHTTIIECKFHNEEGRNCNVKVPLYINSRYNDVKQNWNTNPKNKTNLTQGWVVTNTRFTEDAIVYGNCVGLYLLSWNYPLKNALKDRIDKTGLYPITVSTHLTKEEKDFLLKKHIILCRDLIGNTFILEHLGISEFRKEKILSEIKLLCNL